MATRTETWAAGDRYERYVGRWSRKVASEFLPWLQVPDNARWLDVGCGTGAIAEAILGQSMPMSVHGIDLSPGFIDHARAHVTDARASFEVGDAQDLAGKPQRFDAAVAALLLNFVADPLRTVRGMAALVEPGGTVGAYVWDYLGRMQLMRHFWDAAIALAPAARDLDEAWRFTLCQPEPLKTLFDTAGLNRVEVQPIEVPTRFRDFDDYWAPFLGGNFPAPAYAMSLSEQDRRALRERLRSTLPTDADGSIPLVARAWAVRATVP